jgi:double-stranded uracil-DNA glycosylase
VNERSRLAPLLSDELAVVFVGIEPGQESLRTGHYYADGRNRFYADLAATRFTPRQLVAMQDRDLLSHGIGLDDVYDDPDALRTRIESARPQSVCFNSKAALERFAERKLPSHVWRGAGARSYAELGEVT